MPRTRKPTKKSKSKSIAAIAADPANAAALKKAVPTLDEYVEEYRRQAASFAEAVLKAAKAYVAAIDNYGDSAVDRFNREFPTVRQTTWELLRSIGRGDLTPRIVLCSDVLRQRMLTMPVERQDKILTLGKGFSVLDPATLKMKFVPFSAITERQTKIIFDGAKVRNEDEQREFVASHADELVAKRSGCAPYRVAGRALVVNHRCTLGAAELRAVLAQMEKEEA